MVQIEHGRMQAIVTRFHGPTNTRGARISARTQSGLKVSVPYPYELDHDDRHACAVEALCERYGWKGKLVSGDTKGGHVYVFLPEISS